MEAVLVLGMKPVERVGLVAVPDLQHQAVERSAAPALEYDIFPYSESTRRQIRVLYSIGLSGYQYTDTTIYNRIRESIPFHNVTVAVGLQQVSLKRQWIYRAAYFVPTMVTISVAGILWRWFFNSEFGVLNALLSAPDYEKFVAEEAGH